VTGHGTQRGDAQFALLAGQVGCVVLADAMLGRLARWLRIMGFDTAYLKSAGDDEVLERARSSGRVLLTRDAGLAARAEGEGVRVLRVEGNSLEGQLAQVAAAFSLQLKEEPGFERCALCNTPLEPVEREQAEGRVPAGTFELGYFEIEVVCRSFDNIVRSDSFSKGGFLLMFDV